MAELLLANGANPRVRDGEGWTIIDEASEKSNVLLLGLIFDYMYHERKEQWQTQKQIAIDALKHLPDFYLEMNW